MFSIKGDATVATVTDMRRSASQLLARTEAGESVVVQRNAEAVGVLLSYRTYQQLLETVERLEDLELLVLARRRERAVLGGEDELIELGELLREFGAETDEEEV